MNSRFVMGMIVALGASAGVIACGDDDDDRSATPSTPDSSTPDGGTTTDPDSGPGADGATDGAAPGAAITPASTTRLPNSINPYGLTFASDGLLYASGATIGAGGDRELAVWRFKDGALDTTFGTNGVLSIAIPGSESSFDILEVTPGNFVVQAVTSTVGNEPGKVYLVKLTKDGAGAFAFGTPTVVAFDWTDGDYATWPGTTAAPVPAYSTSWGIGLDKSDAANPRVVVFASGAPAKAAAGATQRIDNDRWVARVLYSTLAADPAFNGGKALSFDADGAGLSDNARRGIVEADGTIVTAGYTNFAPAGNHVVVARIKPNGTIDETFGFGTTAATAKGQTKVNPFTASGGFAEAYGVAKQSTGRFVTTGYGTTNFNVPSIGLDLTSLGFKADGLDPTFGKTGAFGWQSEGDKSAGLGAAPHTERGRDLAVLADDRIVNVGVYDDYASVLVQTKDGQPDTSVGVGGVIQYAYPGAFFKVTVSPDGKQIAASTLSLNQTADAAVALGSVVAILKVGQ